MLKIGGKDVADLRLGTRQVVAAYLGSTLVWSAAGTIGLRGTLLATSALGGEAQVWREIVGGLAAASALAGSAGVVRQVSGSLASVSGAAADATVSRDKLVRGMAVALSALSGAISVSRALAGAAQALSSASSAAAVNRSASGAAVAVSQMIVAAGGVHRQVSGSLASVSDLSGDADVEAGTLTLTQKGYGHVYGASDTANLTMSYANVDGGSAPSAGDLVVWIAMGYDTGGDPRVDLSGSGWAQGGAYNSLFAGTILAKVVSAGDISSPPTVISAPTLGSIGFWVAYTVGGTITSLVASTPNVGWSGTNNTPSQSCNSSGIGADKFAITLGAGGGNDGSPSLSMSGATPSIDFASAENAWGSAAETRFQVNVSAGGANITFSKSDDGSRNHMVSGFITVA